MKPSPKSKKSITSPLRLLETGPNVDKFATNVFKTVLEKHGYMTWTQLAKCYSKILSMPKKKEKTSSLQVLESFISESLLINNKPNWKENESYFLALFQVQKLFKTLDLALPSSDLVFPNWYEKFVATKSLNLLLPIKTESEDLDTIYSNLCARNMDAQSWFTMKEWTMKENEKEENQILRKICTRLLISSLQEIMEERHPSSTEKEEVKKIPPNGILKARLYPTREEKKLLYLMMDGNRWAYNLLLEAIGDRLFKVPTSVLQKEIRDLIKKKEMDKSLAIYEVPEQCFNSAFRDIFKAKATIKANSASKKKKMGKGFSYPERLRNKTKKDSGNSIEIKGRDFEYLSEKREIRFFPRYFGFKKNEGIKIKTDLGKLNIKFDYSCRLVRDGDIFYLNIPYHRIVEEVKTEAVCSIDPGIRSFLPGYDPEKGIFEIATQNDSIYKRQRLISKLQTKMEKETSKRKKKKYGKRINKLYRKIRNCINDMHHKVSKTLSQSFKKILLPEFTTSKMAKKEENNRKRKIGKTSAHRLLTFGHYKFRKLLEHKMKLRGGKVVVCTEEYTSMTCSECGRLNHNLGSSKVFQCGYEDCSLVIDRDVNGARNIYRKNYDLLEKA